MTLPSDGAQSATNVALGGLSWHLALSHSRDPQDWGFRAKGA